MEVALLLVLQVVSWPPVSAVFTVEADRRSYKAEYRDDVTMSCRFKPVPSSWGSGGTGSPSTDLSVIWHRVLPAPSLEVYRWVLGVEKLATQDKGYRGRARLLTEDLEKGWARLQVTQLRINDSGTYQCLLQMGGVDYKQITLSVKAPYENVSTSIQRATGRGDEVELTCRSQGYPLSSVTWRSGDQQEVHPNSTTVTTPDRLFQVTSRIRVRSSRRSNYTCSYADGGSSATFDIPDEIPEIPVNLERNDAVIISSSIVVVLVIAIVAVVIVYRRRKGSRGEGPPSTRNRLVDSESDPAASTACMKTYHYRTEQKDSFTEVPRDGVEALGGVLRARYAGIPIDEEERHRWDSFCQQELPRRLQNSAGQSVNLQALLPAPGEALLLEGPPGSGKTTLAQILASSWARGPTHTPSNHLQELHNLHLLLFLECGNATGDLFQEIRSQQLSLGEKETLIADDLRTVLFGSREVLLVLDGYREGNRALDQSLWRFLTDRRACRVLVTACPGHCPRLRERVGTGGLLTLHMETLEA